MLMRAVAFMCQLRHGWLRDWSHPSGAPHTICTRPQYHPGCTAGAAAQFTVALCRTSCYNSLQTNKREVMQDQLEPAAIVRP